MEPLIVAIDQGTTNSKISIVDSAGQVISEASRPVAVNYPQPGWVEQDPAALWETVQSAIQDALQGVDTEAIAAIAITNQRESALVWERETGKPAGPCVSWQCRRSTPLVARLRRDGLEETVRGKTGLTLDPMFSAGKARWLLDQIPDGRSRGAAGELCFGTVDAWMLWNISGGAVHACDVTNASRTQLFNLQTLDWDTELTEIFGIPRAMLPEVHPSGHIYGSACCSGALPAGIPIAAMIGDSHGALFGHAGFQPGTVKATYGTGSSLMAPIADLIFSRKGLSTSIAWGYQGVTYALEGNIYVTGAAVQWLCQFLNLKTPEAIEALANQVMSNDGLYFVPALVGLGAPYWDADARGLMTGITRGTTASHAARAAIESIAYQIYDVFSALQIEAGQPLTQLMADGGATPNNFLMQFQADILNVPVVRSRVSDLSALGAAYLSGLATGVWKSMDEVSRLSRPHDRFEPHMPESQRTSLLNGWRDAISRAFTARQAI
ncbi:MAG TPA: glycerol kinase GlpK [Levilinea sp.]|nr:glycerol kinase GlpK [Levilinea sp.]